MRRILLALFGSSMLTVAIILVWALAGINPEASAAECRSGNVLDGVHDPERLKVIEACIKIRGTVAIVRENDDGDWDIGVVPDPPDIDLINRTNVTKLGGLMVVEVIPKDQGVVTRPRVGSRVEITGAYVIDTGHSWREIHPAWNISELIPSPIPQGMAERAQNYGHAALRIITRIRAELRERLD